MDENTTTIPAEAAEAFLAWLNAEPTTPPGMDRLRRDLDDVFARLRETQDRVAALENMLVRLVELELESPDDPRKMRAVSEAVDLLKAGCV